MADQPGAAPVSSVVAVCTSALLPNSAAIDDTLNQLSGENKRAAFRECLETAFHVTSFLTPTWNPMTERQLALKIPDTAYIKKYIQNTVAEEKKFDIGAWNYYDRVACALKKAGLCWRNSENTASCIKFLSQLKEISLKTGSQILSHHFEVLRHEKCHPWLVYVQQPPMRRLQDLGLAEGLDAFEQTAKGLNFLPRYENVKEFAIQAVQDDREQADLFYGELLHSVGPAEHPLGNIAEAYQDAFEWSKRMIVC
jgi:hypothetical protein